MIFICGREAGLLCCSTTLSSWRVSQRHVDGPRFAETDDRSLSETALRVPPRGSLGEYVLITPAPGLIELNEFNHRRLVSRRPMPKRLQTSLNPPFILRPESSTGRLSFFFFLHSIICKKSPNAFIVHSTQAVPLV